MRKALVVFAAFVFLALVGYYIHLKRPVVIDKGNQPTTVEDDGSQYAAEVANLNWQGYVSRVQDSCSTSPIENDKKGPVVYLSITYKAECFALLKAGLGVTRWPVMNQLDAYRTGGKIVLLGTREALKALGFPLS